MGSAALWGPKDRLSQGHTSVIPTPGGGALCLPRVVRECKGGALISRRGEGPLSAFLSLIPSCKTGVLGAGQGWPPCWLTGAYDP